MPCAASSALACGFFWHSESASGRLPVYWTPSSSNSAGTWCSCSGSSWKNSTRFITTSGLRALERGEQVVSKLSRMLTSVASWPAPSQRADDQLHLLLDGLPRLDLERSGPSRGRAGRRDDSARTHRRRSGSRGSGCVPYSDDALPQVPPRARDVDDRGACDRVRTRGSGRPRAPWIARDRRRPRGGAGRDRARLATAAANQRASSSAVANRSSAIASRGRSRGRDRRRSGAARASTAASARGRRPRRASSGRPCR